MRAVEDEVQFAEQIGRGGVAEVVERIHKERLSGILHVVHLAWLFELHFANGEVASARSNLPGHRFDRLLGREGIVSRKQTEEIFVKALAVREGQFWFEASPLAAWKSGQALGLSVRSLIERARVVSEAHG